jgi:hypothetical protein
VEQEEPEVAAEEVVAAAVAAVVEVEVNSIYHRHVIATLA